MNLIEKICPECGAENSNNTGFCETCGTSLEVAPTKSTPASKRKKSNVTETVQRKENLQININSEPGPAPSKPHGNFFLWTVIIVVIIGTIIVIPLIFLPHPAGQTASQSPVTALPTIAVVPTQVQDPIIGTWHWTVYGQDAKTTLYTFTADGKYSTTDTVTQIIQSGTWQKMSENQYVATANRKRELFVYQPGTNTIAFADNPEIPFYPPGNGSVIFTPTPTVMHTITTTPYSSYSYSGGDTGTSSGESSGQCWVNGYTRKDGTSVSGYYRRC